MTIINFLDMINNDEFEVKIYIIEKDETYLFNIDEIPEELLYCTINKIDVPCYFDPNYQPIEILINLNNFDNYDTFKEEFKGYLI